MINKITLSTPGGYDIYQTPRAGHLDEGFKDINALIGWSITMLMIIATIVCVGLIVYGGIRWITSSGDKAGIESARNIIVYALIGLVIVFTSFAIIKLIGTIFGIELI